MPDSEGSSLLPYRAYPIERKTTNPDGESKRPKNQHHVIDMVAMIARAMINSKQVNPHFRI